VPQTGLGSWHFDASGLPERPSIVDARDRLVDWFALTHGVGFAASKAELGLPSNADAVRSTAVGLVRIAFNQVGGSFDDPTPETLSRVVDLLTERSLAWGAPHDMVVRHQAQFQELLTAAEQPWTASSSGGSAQAW
jgi:hypothetical protein